MPRSALTIQNATIAGVTPTYAAANVAGNMLPATDDYLLHVKNGSGAPITVTIVTPITVDGRAVADDTVTVAAGGEKMIGGFVRETHGQPSGGTDAGQVYIDYSAVTTVTVGAFKL